MRHTGEIQMLQAVDTAEYKRVIGTEINRMLAISVTYLQERSPFLVFAPKTAQRSSIFNRQKVAVILSIIRHRPLPAPQFVSQLVGRFSRPRSADSADGKEWPVRERGQMRNRDFGWCQTAVHTELLSLSLHR